RQRVDVVALALSGSVLQGHCLPDGGVRGNPVLIGHHHLAVTRYVDVRAERERLAPVAHRALRIEALRRAKRTRRLSMVERKVDDETLVEISLGVGIFGRDRMVVVAHTVEEWCPRAPNEVTVAIGGFRNLGFGSLLPRA